MKEKGEEWEMNKRKGPCYRHDEGCFTEWFVIIQIYHHRFITSRDKTSLQTLSSLSIYKDFEIKIEIKDKNIEMLNKE